MSEQYPETDTGTRPTIAGDSHDKDAETLDSMYRDAAAPPAAITLPLADNVPMIKPKAITRIMSGRVTLAPTDAPIPLLPADPNRKHLVVRVFTTVATDSIRLADDPGKLQAPTNQLSQQSYSVYPNFSYDNNDHTGPIWASARDASAAVVVSWAATTE